MVVVILIVAIGTCQLSGTSHAVFTFLAFFHGHSLTILHLSSLSASSMEISGRGFSKVSVFIALNGLSAPSDDLGKGLFYFGEIF